MTEALIDHLWQSTLCALAAALLTLAFRRNAARVRYLIWLAASVKFLIPFSLLVWIGTRLSWHAAPALQSDLSSVIGQIAQPGIAVTSGLASARLAHAGLYSTANIWTIVLATWLLGALFLIGRRLYQWLYLRAVAEAASPLDIDTPIPVLETRSSLEPGIFGIFSPTLLLPEGITTQLPPDQLRTILDHEMCHWRRKDNLTAAIQMLVEALCWFHPMIWWLGNRLIVERERACDEAVIQSGSDRQTYAEGILLVCRRYLEPPPCSASVSGGSLRKRIEEIMTSPPLRQLPLLKKCALAVIGILAIAGPLAAGVNAGPAAARDADSASVEMTHYASNEWHFALDIPKRWIVMPPVTSNSPYEVMRFMSREEGSHNLIVFRSPLDPKQSLDAVVSGTQTVLAKAGFSNFITGEITVGSRRVPTLDYSKLAPDGVTVWYCRQYFIANGPLGYVLGFGTTNPDRMFGLYDRMAKTFTFE